MNWTGGSRKMKLSNNTSRSSCWNVFDSFKSKWKNPLLKSSLSTCLPSHSNEEDEIDSWVQKTRKNSILASIKQGLNLSHLVSIDEDDDEERHVKKQEKTTRKSLLPSKQMLQPMGKTRRPPIEYETVSPTHKPHEHSQIPSSVTRISLPPSTRFIAIENTANVMPAPPSPSSAHEYMTIDSVAGNVSYNYPDTEKDELNEEGIRSCFGTENNEWNNFFEYPAPSPGVENAYMNDDPEGSAPSNSGRHQNNQVTLIKPTPVQVVNDRISASRISVHQPEPISKPHTRTITPMSQDLSRQEEQEWLTFLDDAFGHNSTQDIQDLYDDERVAVRDNNAMTHIPGQLSEPHEQETKDDVKDENIHSMDPEFFMFSPFSTFRSQSESTQKRDSVSQSYKDILVEQSSPVIAGTAQTHHIERDELRHSRHPCSSLSIDGILNQFDDTGQHRPFKAHRVESSSPVKDAFNFHDLFSGVTESPSLTCAQHHQGEDVPDTGAPSHSSNVSPPPAPSSCPPCLPNRQPPFCDNDTFLIQDSQAEFDVDDPVHADDTGPPEVEGMSHDIFLLGKGIQLHPSPTFTEAIPTQRNQIESFTKKKGEIKQVASPKKPTTNDTISNVPNDQDNHDPVTQIKSTHQEKSEPLDEPKHFSLKRALEDLVDDHVSQFKKRLLHLVDEYGLS